MEVWIKPGKDLNRQTELIMATLTAMVMIVLILLVQRIANPNPEIVTVADKLKPITVFPDFASIQDIQLKKQQFFDYIEAYIVAENDRVSALRKELASYRDVVDSSIALSPQERERVLSLASKYRVESNQSEEKLIVDELLLKVDVIPISLVLAQAANESAWGTSRFALEGNNIFGQWCYVEGCGIVPRRRPSGASHEVKRFDSIDHAVEAYFLNINSHPVYSYLREIRAQLRRQQEALNPMVLAYGLGRYSERGEHYVDEVQTIIEQNNLRQRDTH